METLFLYSTRLFVLVPFCPIILSCLRAVYFKALRTRWGLKPGFIMTCWRTGFLALTQAGATFGACQSDEPRGKAYCPQTDPAPFGVVYLNETLRPCGVCWGKVRNAKYLPSSFLSSFHSRPFSLVSQKSRVNIPTLQLCSTEPIPRSVFPLFTLGSRLCSKLRNLPLVFDAFAFP